MDDKTRLCNALDTLLNRPVYSKTCPSTHGEQVDLACGRLLLAIAEGRFRDEVAGLMISVANETRAAMEREHPEGGGGEAEHPVTTEEQKDSLPPPRQEEVMIADPDWSTYRGIYPATCEHEGNIEDPLPG